jgi:hypothetical protein
MPDNVSLTVSEINEMKQTSNSLKSRLKDIRFYFSPSNNTKSTKELPIISDDKGGLIMYAARETLPLGKTTNNTIVFTLPKIDFSATPVIQVSLSAATDKSKYLLNTSATWDPSGKITVHVSSGVDSKTLTKDKPSVVVNVLAIGYA